MEHAYAEALFRMIKGGRSPHEVVAQLKNSLAARGRSALLPKIARSFSKIAARDEAKSSMTLMVARQKDAAHAIKEAEQALAGYQLGAFDMCEQVEESLVGGWRLEGKGLLIDRSWKAALLSMYNRATR